MLRSWVLPTIGVVGDKGRCIFKYTATVPQTPLGHLRRCPCSKGNANGGRSDPVGFPLEFEPKDTRRGVRTLSSRVRWNVAVVAVGKHCGALTLNWKTCSNPRGLAAPCLALSSPGSMGSGNGRTVRPHKHMNVHDNTARQCGMGRCVQAMPNACLRRKLHANPAGLKRLCELWGERNDPIGFAGVSL